MSRPRLGSVRVGDVGSPPREGEPLGEARGVREGATPQPPEAGPAEGGQEVGNGCGRAGGPGCPEGGRSPRGRGAPSPLPECDPAPGGRRGGRPGRGRLGAHGHVETLLPA